MYNSPPTPLANFLQSVNPPQQAKTAKLYLVSVSVIFSYCITLVPSQSPGEGCTVIYGSL